MEFKVFNGAENRKTDETLFFKAIKNAKKSVYLESYIFEYFSRYQEFLLGKDMDILERSATFLNKIASAKDGNMFRKYLAMTSLLKIAEDLSKTKETSDNPNIASLLKKVALMISSIAKN